MSVRVRYAPSPTGLQHIGGLRTALFNYLFARSQKGVFYLRLEDTDQLRCHKDAEEDLYTTLRWAGIDWDEGPDKGGPYAPYIQSQRLQLYQDHARQLVKEGKAYECYCTPQRLDRIRKIQEANKMPPGYDRRCLTLTAQELEQAKDEGIIAVIRFKVPLEGSTIIKDMILGDVERTNADISPDPVILKSDGFPTYHLAHVIDDHFMQTTHVLRAQEWLSSASLHALLFQAFHWPLPQYCHLPLILGPDGQKLSKRHGATSVRQFKESGYLSSALINYLALLGWSYDDSREFFSQSELEQVFSLKRLNKSPAVFDYKKLEHFNGYYIRQTSNAELKAQFIPILQKEQLTSDPLTEEEERLLEGFIPLLKERLKFTTEVADMTRFVWQDVNSWFLEDLVPKKLDKAQTMIILQTAITLLNGYEQRSDEENEALFRLQSDKMSIKLGDFMQPVRVAVTGKRISPPMFGSIRLLGTTLVKKRLIEALEFLKKS